MILSFCFVCSRLEHAVVKNGGYFKQGWQMLRKHITWCMGSHHQNLYRINLLSTLLSFSLVFFSLYESSSYVSSLARFRRYSLLSYWPNAVSILSFLFLVLTYKWLRWNSSCAFSSLFSCSSQISEWQTPESLLSQICLSCQGKPCWIV